MLGKFVPLLFYEGEFLDGLIQDSQRESASSDKVPMKRDFVLSFYCLT